MNEPIERIATKSLTKKLKGFSLGAYYLDIVILLRFNENIWKQSYHNNNEIFGQASFYFLEPAVNTEMCRLCYIQ